jgi:hypothetical protein
MAVVLKTDQVVPQFRDIRAQIHDFTADSAQ